jgi:hypothetical protein
MGLIAKQAQRLMLIIHGEYLVPKKSFGYFHSQAIRGR